MSVHDDAAPRKPRRLGLYLPFILLIVLAAIWTAAWFWIRGEAGRQMDAAVQQLTAAGYDIAWKERRIAGYPFRISVELTDAVVQEPSGWALHAPLLEGEAYLFTPTNWVFGTPRGLTFTRPAKGPVTVTGRVIRLSLSHLTSQPPHVSFQGLGLTFQPAPGAQPFALSAAEKVEFHLRSGPDDEGLVAAKVEKGKARLSGLFARIAGDKPVDMSWNSRLTHMSAFKGQDWPSAVRNWVAAGGRMRVVDGGVTAGEALIGAQGGLLSVSGEGRLQGVLDVTLRQAPQALGALGDMRVIPQDRAEAAAAVAAARQGTDESARATINFEAGLTTLGPIAIGPAPKVYDPR